MLLRILHDSVFIVKYEFFSNLLWCEFFSNLLCIASLESSLYTSAGGRSDIAGFRPQIIQTFIAQKNRSVFKLQTQTGSIQFVNLSAEILNRLYIAVKAFAADGSSCHKGNIGMFSKFLSAVYIRQMNLYRLDSYSFDSIKYRNACMGIGCGIYYYTVCIAVGLLDFVYYKTFGIRLVNLYINTFLFTSLLYQPHKLLISIPAVYIRLSYSQHIQIFIILFTPTSVCIFTLFNCSLCNQFSIFVIDHNVRFVVVHHTVPARCINI